MCDRGAWHSSLCSSAPRGSRSSLVARPDACRFDDLPYAASFHQLANWAFIGATTYWMAKATWHRYAPAKHGGGARQGRRLLHSQLARRQVESDSDESDEERGLLDGR